MMRKQRWSKKTYFQPALKEQFGFYWIGQIVKPKNILFIIQMFGGGQNQNAVSVLYGISFMEKLHQFDPSTQKWIEIKGTTYKYGTLDTLGNVWGMNWKRQLVTGSTLTTDSGFSAPATLASFVVGPDKRIWGVDNFGEIHSGFLDNANWTKVGKQKMKKLAIDTLYRVWGITDSGQVHFYESNQGPNGNWTKVNSNTPTGKVVDIATTPNGGIWLLNDHGDVLEKLVNDLDWRLRKNLASSNITGIRKLAVKPFDVFGIDAFDKLYRLRDGHWNQFGNEKMSLLF